MLPLAEALPIGAPAVGVPPRPVVASTRWLAALLAAVALAATGLFALGAARDHAATLEAAWSRAEGAARLLASQVQNALDTSEFATDHVARLVREHGVERLRGPGRASLLRIVDSVPQIGSIWVYDASARLLVSTEDPNPPELDFSDRSYARALREGATAHVSGMLIGRITGSPFFAYSHAIREDGRLLGIAQTAIGGRLFNDLHDDLRLTPGSRLTLRRLDGTLVMMWPLGPEGDRGAEFEPAPGREEGRLEVDGPAGTAELLAWRVVAGWDMVALARLPRAAALAPWRARLLAGLGLLGLAGAIAAGLAWAAIAAARREVQAAAQERLARAALDERSAALATALEGQAQLLVNLRESEDRVRRVVDQLLVFVWLLTPAGELLEANAGPLRGHPNGLAAAPGAKLWDGPWWCHDPETRARLELACKRAAAGELDRYEGECRLGEERIHTLDMQVAPLRNGDGGITHLVASAVDVTEQRASERQRLLLAREVDHRAKNVMAVVLSIVRLSQAGDPQRFVAVVEGRVAALARAHGLLAGNRWAGAELAAIALEELGGLGTPERVRLAGPAVRLKADAVQPVAMVLHELATNAVKHGALSSPTGRVALSWRVTAAGPLELDWVELGGPAVAAPVHRGFGTRLVDATLRGQLGGTITPDWAPGGLRCRIELPGRWMRAGGEG